MSFELIVRKILLRESRFISGEEIKNYSKLLGMKYNAVISYLIRHKYLKRILKGFFYVPTIEERKLKTEGTNYLEAIAMAMEHKKIKNWYFGLETAIKMNGITHEVFTMDYVISDSLFRAKPITIWGNKIRFVKLSEKLLRFGVKRNGKVPFSDLEKSLLDKIHLGIYAGRTPESIKGEILEWSDHANKKKMATYAKHYSLSVRKIVGELK